MVDPFPAVHKELPTNTSYLQYKGVWDMQDLYDVLVAVTPDEDSINYASDRVKELIERNKGTSEGSIDSVVDDGHSDKSKQREEIRQYNVEAMEPLIGYLEELGKIKEKDYTILEMIGFINVQLTKSQIYEVAEVDNVAAIMENQEVHVINKKS